MKKDYLDQFLNEQEQAKISQFVMDDVMREAVKKVLLFGLYNSGTIEKGKIHDPMHNFALVKAADADVGDKELADYVRACYQGINAIELGFGDLARYKLEEIKPEKSNPAR